MYLNFPLFDEKIKLSNLTILVLEDTVAFAKFAQVLHCYTGEESELKIFDDKEKTIKSSELMCITDVLGFDLNSRTNLKLIHENLEHQLNDKPEIKSSIERLASEIATIMSQELLEHELDLEQDEITLQELFSVLGIKIETSSDTVFDKLFEIFQVYQYLTKIKLLIFVNVASYLTMDELKQIQDYVHLMGKEVLFIEPKKVADLPQYVLDCDYYMNGENMI